jgi:hypothetical protein
MGNEQTKQLQQKTMRPPRLTASKEKITRIDEGFRVALNEKLEIATIPEMVMNPQFLNDNRHKIFIVSAKNALDLNNEALKNVSITTEAREIIKKTQEDGKERLLAFVNDTDGFYLDQRIVAPSVWPGREAQVAGKQIIDGSTQAAKTLVMEKGEVLEVTLRGGKKYV